MINYWRFTELLELIVFAVKMVLKDFSAKLIFSRQIFFLLRKIFFFQNTKKMAGKN
jgi:hypothetical protein